MNPSVLVLANLSDSAAQATRWAAVLGAPLRARLELLHLYQGPESDPEPATLASIYAQESQAETAEALEALGQQLATPTGVTITHEPLAEAVASAVHQHHPLLLALGLSEEHTLLDHLLRNRALPALRATHRPLLLVPEDAPEPRLPRRVVIAVDAEPFRLSAAARALAPLMAAWHASYTVVHVTSAPEPLALSSRMALADVRASHLLPPATSLVLQESHHPSPATGIVEALYGPRIDLLVLIARTRSFLGRLFHRSVTAQVLRHTPVPVLLLPAEASELPDWMPSMS
ncbi:universal stress protein [Microvirga sp. STS02]|uniref:universal stress protein n=1 Tax=Hymenobacter negativus TaxID=2795026 RepID=UPI0018DCDE77|nr:MULTISPECIES: universal stress protein [Bacteria]MBH8567456.1 universal stress protein [Hymenobacter negativus]MBR7207188.1 universal stress protein [Microvirga sp. STS02]